MKPQLHPDEEPAPLVTPTVFHMRNTRYDQFIAEHFSTGDNSLSGARRVDLLRNQLAFLKIEDIDLWGNIIARLKYHILNEDYRDLLPPELYDFVERLDLESSISELDFRGFFGLYVPRRLVEKDYAAVARSVIDEGKKNEIIDACISNLKFACFDDDPLILKAILPVQLADIGVKNDNITLYNTNLHVTSSTEIRFRPQFNIIDAVDVVVSDINDAGNGSIGADVRGEHGLSKGKIFVFISGIADNRELIDAKFKERYGNQYIFLDKPYSLEKLQETIRDLVWRNICNKK